MTDAPTETTARTRQRIVQAVADLLLTEHPAAFSVPEVARRAGVSTRTVYRYYPTKEQLLDGLADLGGEASQRLLSDPAAHTGAGTFDEYVEALPELWGELHKHAAYLRAQAANPLLRETRSRRTADRRERIERGLRAEDPGLSDDDAARLTSLLQVLGSSWTMLDLVDEAGLTPTDAAELVQWAMRALLVATQQANDAGDSDAEHH